MTVQDFPHTDLKLRLLASCLIEGNATCLPAVEHELYTFAEWQAEARACADADDFEPLAWMLRREALFQEWKRLSTQSDWAEDFENYWAALNKPARLPNLPGKYPFSEGVRHNV